MVANETWADKQLDIYYKNRTGKHNSLRYDE